MDRIVPFAERPRSQQVLAAVVAPVVYGLIAGFVLGASAAVYWAMQALGAIGGLLGGMEHPTLRGGAMRCGLGGFLYGVFLLLAHELSGAEPEVDIGDSKIALVLVTTIGGVLIGAAGAALGRRAAASR